jgi:hypothetical protein
VQAARARELLYGVSRRPHERIAVAPLLRRGSVAGERENESDPEAAARHASL